MSAVGSAWERKVYRQEVRRDVRRLPRVLQAIVGKVRVSQVLAGVLMAIELDVEAAAVVKGVLKRKHKRGQLGELDRRLLLEEMAGREDYRRRVLRLVNEAVRNAHLDRVRRSDGESPPEDVPAIEIPTTGTWTVRADLGLGTASFLEAMPDGVGLGIARLLGRDALRTGDEEVDDLDLDEVVPGLASPKRVVVYGAGPSTLAGAVDALGLAKTIRITEVDAIETERTAACIEASYRLMGNEAFEDVYDAAVVHLPAPAGVGGERHRHIYYTDTGVPALDMGRLGSRRWSFLLKGFAVSVGKAVHEGGLLVMYVPTGVRGWNEYLPAPGLLEGLDEELARAGFEIERDVVVHEEGPVAQPFVGMNRCPWRLVVARKTGAAS